MVTTWDAPEANAPNCRADLVNKGDQAIALPGSREARLKVDCAERFRTWVTVTKRP